MTRYCQDPKLDENAKVGLSFIGIGYGVVLVAVFPTIQPSHIGLAGWFHLGLAASVLVISYMGYYSNRQEYAAWRVRFFNIPLTQYLISFGILFLYWELGITLPKDSSQATPVSEAVIMIIIFGAYLVWDCLEVTVQESGRYIYALYRARRPDMLPPLIRRYRQGLWRQRPVSTKSRWRRRRIHRFAKDVRAGRAVTFLFLLLYGLGLALVVIYNVRGTVSVAVVDGVFTLGLFLYRYSQWVWARCWYHRI